MKHEGMLRISAARYIDGDRVSVLLVDRSSGCLMVETEASLANMAAAVFIGGSVDCQFTLGPTDRAGKRVETKRVVVVLPDGPDETREERARKAVSELESDGWVGDWLDLFDAARLIRTPSMNRYNVQFRRWVSSEDRTSDEGSTGLRQDNYGQEADEAVPGERV